MEPVSGIMSRAQRNQEGSPLFFPPTDGHGEYMSSGFSEGASTWRPDRCGEQRPPSATPCPGSPAPAVTRGSAVSPLLFPGGTCPAAQTAVCAVSLLSRLRCAYAQACARGRAACSGLLCGACPTIWQGVYQSAGHAARVRWVVVPCW